MYSCKKCNSSNMILQTKNTNTGLYCRSCGAWQKWLSKEEIRTAHFNKIPMHDAANTKDVSKKEKSKNKQIKSLFTDSGPFEENNVKDASNEIKRMKKDDVVSLIIEIPKEQAQEMLNVIEILNKELKRKLDEK